MDTIHEHCSHIFLKIYKNFKMFLVYDLIYGIFILRFLEMH